MRLKRKICLNLTPFPKKEEAIVKNRKPEKVPENGFTIWVRSYSINSVKSWIFGYLWKCDNSWLYLNILGLEPYAPQRRMIFSFSFFIIPLQSLIQRRKKSLATYLPLLYSITSTSWNRFETDSNSTPFHGLRLNGLNHAVIMLQCSQQSPTGESFPTGAPFC